MLGELPAAPSREVVGVEPLDKRVKALFQLADAHWRRLVVHVEQRASLPGARIQNAILAFQALVKRRARTGNPSVAEKISYAAVERL